MTAQFVGAQHLVSDAEEIDRLIKAMRELVEESRRLAKRHDEVIKEYERLREKLEKAQARRHGPVN